MARLVLVGLPGAGKSTLGQALADHLSRPFIDIDTAFAEQAGMTAAVFIGLEGEPEFRKREVEALRRSLEENAVIATGGGIVTSSDARELLQGHVVLWLDCANDVLVERVADGERPLLGDDQATGLALLRRDREQLYEEVATRRIDASGSVDEVLDRIRSALSEMAQ